MVPDTKDQLSPYHVKLLGFLAIVESIEQMKPVQVDKTHVVCVGFDNLMYITKVYKCTPLCSNFNLVDVILRVLATLTICGIFSGLGAVGYFLMLLLRAKERLRCYCVIKIWNGICKKQKKWQR